MSTDTFSNPDMPGYVGFANLPNQIHRKSVKRGFEFTLMVVGESGLGKSTLINTLFLTDLYPDRVMPSAQECIEKTVKIDVSTVEIEERGVKVRLTVVDTPGYGDAIDNTDCFQSIISYINDQFERYLQDESGLNRRHIVDNRVHCCFYFINPAGHGLKPLDIQFMKQLHNKVNIVPVIAKADTLTKQEVAKLKRKVLDEIEENGIHIYPLPDCDTDEEEDYKEQVRLLKEAVPFAVVGSTTVLDVGGKKVRGRQYPWGVIEVENPNHCDFIKLRCLLGTHMQDLTEVTQDVHYENYRSERLAKGGSAPLSASAATTNANSVAAPPKKQSPTAMVSGPDKERAGTEPAVTFVVDNVKELVLEIDFYSVIVANVRSPAAIPKILNMLLNEGEGVDHSIGVMNFANLAHDACLSEDRKHFYFDYSCGPKSTCDPELIITTFIPYLVRNLGNQEKDVWQRLIYLQALSNLGTPQTINVLKPIIFGVTETNIFMRTNAIWSLSAYNMQKSALSQIYEILMPIIENKGEQFEIRNIAFLTLATWGPGHAWWQQLAVSTWHDPSPQFANFVTTTIYSIADSHTKLADTVSRVKHLCKPAAPSSILQSTNFFLHEYLFSEEHGSRVNFAWFASVHGPVPEEVFVRVQEELFYGYTLVTKVDLQQRGLDSYLHRWKVAMEKSHKRPVQSSTQEIVTGMWEELKEKIGYTSPTALPYLRMWYKLNRVLFKVGEDLGFYANTDTIDFIRHTPIFDRDLFTVIALPTETGLPFDVQYVDESAISLNIQHTDHSSSDGKVKVSVSLVFEASQDLFVEARVFLPWSERPAVTSGLYAKSEVLLPVNVHASFNLINQEIELSIEPTNTEKIDVIQSEVVPFTVLENNYPCEVLLTDNEYKPILHGEVPLFNDKHQVFPSDVGLWVEVVTDGDIHHTPSVYEWIIQLVSLSITTHTREEKVIFDPTLSTTKAVSFTFNYVSTGGSGSLVDQTDYDDGQVSQGSFDEDFGQFSQVAGGSQDTLEVDSFGTQSQTRERIMRLQQALIASGGHVRTISVEIELQGTPTRNYEASLTWAISSSGSARSSKVQVTLMKHPAVGVLEDPYTICLNAQIMKPHFNPFFTTEDVLTANYHSTIKAELYEGETCEEAPVLLLEASFDVSNDAKEKVKEAIEKGCDYSTYAPGIDIITSPLYDHSHITATWTPDFPDSLKNLTYYVDDIIKASLSQKIEFDHTTAHYDARVEVDATKCIETGLWTVRTEKPYAVSIIKDLEVPAWVNPIFTPAPLATTLLYDLAVGRTPVSCTIDESKVRTADGKVFSYEPSQCWNAITFDTTSDQRGAMLVRNTGQWEVRIIWQKEGLVIDMSPTNFLVNGEPAKGTDNRYTVFHHDDSHTILFESGTRVKVSDKVEVLLGLDHRGHTTGLCGNFDGEPSNDMVGPKGCYYTDAHLFALSWASPGEGCAAFNFKSLKRDVDRYQEDCPHFAHEPTGVTHGDALYDCTEWVYHERTEGQYHCKALSPMPVCRPECVANHPITTSVEYECKFSGHQQQAQQLQQQVQGTKWVECFPHSYTLTYPSSCVPQ